MDASRPQIQPARSRLEWALELVSIIAALAPTSMVAFLWRSLPERVPSHFDAVGKPDAFASKESLLVPVCLSLGLYVLLTAIQFVPSWRYNYPTLITSENAERQYRKGRMVLASAKALLTLVIASATFLTMQVGLGLRAGLGALFLPITLGAALLLVIWACAGGKPRPGS